MSTTKKKRPPHRGANGDEVEFARRFVLQRIDGFRKDVEICLTPREWPGKPNSTHAYFPALGACCAMLEYLTGLERGSLHGVRVDRVVEYAARYLPQPGYSPRVTTVLVEAFRHRVNHHGIASGVWVNGAPDDPAAERMTWRIWEDSEKPAINIKPEVSYLESDSPWKCPYTHRVHIHLASLASDIADSADRYLQALAANPALVTKFYRCMKQMYPVPEGMSFH
jgi:hypothetical protein